MTSVYSENRNTTQAHKFLFKVRTGSSVKVIAAPEIDEKYPIMSLKNAVLK